MVADSPKNNPRAQKATDKDLIAAVERVTQMLDAPAVPTSQVAAELPIKRQTVNRRLDNLAEEGYVASLTAGQGRIWWIPEDGGGHVDPSALDSSIDLESINPYDIPPAVAREIATKRVAEFSPPETFWERLYEWSDGRADDVITLVAIAMVFILFPDLGFFEEQLLAIGIGTGLIELIGLFVLTGAIGVALVAGIARIAGVVGQRAVRQGYVGEEPLDAELINQFK